MGNSNVVASMVGDTEMSVDQSGVYVDPPVLDVNQSVMYVNQSEMYVDPPVLDVNQPETEDSLTEAAFWMDLDACLDVVEPSRLDVLIAELVDENCDPAAGMLE